MNTEQKHHVLIFPGRNDMEISFYNHGDKVSITKLLGAQQTDKDVSLKEAREEWWKLKKDGWKDKPLTS